MPYSPPAGNAVEIRFLGAYTPPAGSAVALYFGDPEPPPDPIRRVVFAQTRARWGFGQRAEREVRARWDVGARFDAQRGLGLAAAVATDMQLDLAWGEAGRADRQSALRITPAAPLDVQVDAPWGSSAARDVQRGERWAAAAPLDDESRALPWRAAAPRDRERKADWGLGVGLDHLVHLATGKARARDAQPHLPWGMGAAPRWRFVIAPPPLPPLPAPSACYTPPLGRDARLLFAGAYTPPLGNAADLRFVCGADRYYYIGRSLRVSHTISVVRLPDRLPLSVLAVSMSADMGSWAWSFSLRFADRTSLLAVAPDANGPKSVEITLDGYVWTALVEGYTDDRSFNKSGLSSNGRSRTALLAEPFQAARSYVLDAPSTAQQLAARELEFSGYSLDWQIDDWPVPAGAWRYDRETPLSAILRIAKSTGAVVQSAPGSDILIVQPRYTTAPWTWGTQLVDATLDAASILNLGKRWQAGQGYNGVYVSGRNQGVLVNVVRDGSPGSPYAEMVVDDLVTDVIPARGVGLSVIASSLDREEIKLSIPLRPAPDAPGLLMPGELVQVIDPVWGTFRAQVDSLSIDASRGGQNDPLTARQNISVSRIFT